MLSKLSAVAFDQTDDMPSPFRRVFFPVALGGPDTRIAARAIIIHV